MAVVIVVAVSKDYSQLNCSAMLLLINCSIFKLGISLNLGREQGSRMRNFITTTVLIYFIGFAFGHANYVSRPPTGVNNSCDPGDDVQRMDWDDSSNLDYMCQTSEKPLVDYDHSARILCRPIDYPWHVCINERIVYKDSPPLSGPHRPSWPRYGEYLYLPPQRYVHSLEHGAAVFLYHPCSNATEIAKLRNLARSCLYRYVFSPSRLVPTARPFAILTWGCMLTMGKVDTWLSRHYVRRYAVHQAPEAHVSTDGQYSRGLMFPAKIVSNQADSLLCPTAQEKEQFSNAFRASSARTPRKGPLL